MEPIEPGLRLFVVVGSERAHDHIHVRVEDLAEHVAGALEKCESVSLGFYDGGYAESADFRPTRLAHDDGLRLMKIFTGWVGTGYRYPACLIISQGEGEPEAVLIFTSNLGTSDPDGDD
jgi:hypothetical protein